MNTVRADRDGVQDTIAAPAAAARWLRAVRPEVGIAGREAVAGLQDLRDALRHLAAAATGDDREAAVAAIADQEPTADPTAADLEAAVGALNRACARAPSWSELHWPGDDDPAATEHETGAADEAGPAGETGPRRVVRTAHDPALAAVAAIAEEAVALFAGPDRLLLRACRAPGCVLYFVRNHPRREWCSDGCGNRARVARHYQRHHGGSRESD